MNKVPWIDNSVRFLIKAGSNKGLRIEEIKEPWDLLLEGHFLKSNIGSPDHIDWIKEAKERVFSIRNQNREPIADIICMPSDVNRTDIYWSNLRFFKTSNPMKVDGQDLIVLGVLAKHEKRPTKAVLQITKEFFTVNGGTFGNEWPLGVTVKTEKDLRSWQKKCHGYIEWNLCIGSTVAFVKECQTQTTNVHDSINKLRGFFDNIYICSEDEWTEKIMEHLEKHPADLPKDRFIVYGPTDTRRQEYLDRANAIYKKLAQEQEWGMI